MQDSYFYLGKKTIMHFLTQLLDNLLTEDRSFSGLRCLTFKLQTLKTLQWKHSKAQFRRSLNIWIDKTNRILQNPFLFVKMLLIFVFNSCHLVSQIINKFVSKWDSLLVNTVYYSGFVFESKREYHGNSMFELCVWRNLSI